MAIKSLSISNYKSFERISINLSDFNMVIGANASGKSNLISIMSFMRDISIYGIDNAISMQGGVEYLRNIIIGKKLPTEIDIILDNSVSVIVSMNNKEKISYMVASSNIRYSFAIEYTRNGSNFNVIRDELDIVGHLLGYNSSNPDKIEQFVIGDAAINIKNDNGKSIITTNLPDGINKGEVGYLNFLDIFDQKKPSQKSIMLDYGFKDLSIFVSGLGSTFSGISVYDFDPKLPKKAVSISGKNTLEPDGSNIAIVLKNILSDNKSRKSLHNIIKHILPFVGDVSVEKVADKSLLFSIKENFTNNVYLPSSLMSDGTVNITSLIIALFFSPDKITVLEEPERNLHPSLISKVAEMLKDASRKKQIIMTTHNPYIVQNVGVDNLILVTRDSRGFSNVTRPSDKEMVRTFLENEIGLDELFIQNLLGL